MSKGKPSNGEPVKLVARNRQAFRRYNILEKFEAGIQLQGTEVKSLRRGNCSLDEAFARPREHEIFILNMNIAPYEEGNRENHEPKRPRKLLLHKREIRQIIHNVEQKGLTIIPLSLYFKRGRAKVEVALAKGKTFADRRQDIKARESKREVESEIRRRRK